LLSAVLTWPAHLYASTSAIIDVLALSLGVELPEEALEVPQTPLSAEFQSQFRSRSSLRPETVRYYLKTHPSEFLAFRNYIQRLHDNNYLSHEESVALVGSAFNGFVTYANSIASDTNTTEANAQSAGSESSASVVTAQSPSEQAIEDAVANAERADITVTEVPTYEFGEDVQRKQDEAALAEAARVTAELEADKRRKRLEAQAAFLMQELAKANNPREKLLDRVNRILNQHTEQVVQEKADELFDNAEISITSTDSGPQFDARVLKAFDLNPKDGVFNYGELGLIDNDDRQTLNIGYGIRLLDPSEMVMYGGNVFFDQEWPNNHQRASVGIEMVTSPLRLSANRYYALSGGQQLSDVITERAMSGHDLNAKIAFPYLPYLFLDYSKFKWYGEDGLDDVKGQTVGVSGSLSDSFSIELERKVYNSNDYASQNSARLTYRYVPGSNKSPNIFTPISVPYVLERLDAREKFAMTNRENEIQKQQTTAGLQVTFTSL
jgi:hypothetical protein